MNVGYFARSIADGDPIEVDGLVLRSMHTPGHTDDSYSFQVDGRVFTGDTPLIGGTGRTDLASGDPRAQYDSLFNKLLKLPGETLVFPGHDYKGNRMSTIATEIASNPRLRNRSVEDYVLTMNGLRLPWPRLMDVAIPANIGLGINSGRDKRSDRR